MFEYGTLGHMPSMSEFLQKSNHIGTGPFLQTKILTRVKSDRAFDKSVCWREQPPQCHLLHRGRRLCFPSWELSDPFLTVGKSRTHSCSDFPRVTLLPKHCLIKESPFSAGESFHLPPINPDSGEKLFTFCDTLNTRLMSPPSLP